MSRTHNVRRYDTAEILMLVVGVLVVAAIVFLF